MHRLGHLGLKPQSRSTSSRGCSIPATSWGEAAGYTFRGLGKLARRQRIGKAALEASGKSGEDNWTSALALLQRVHKIGGNESSEAMPIHERHYLNNRFYYGLVLALSSKACSHRAQKVYQSDITAGTCIMMQALAMIASDAAAKRG